MTLILFFVAVVRQFQLVESEVIEADSIIIVETILKAIVEHVFPPIWDDVIFILHCWRQQL
jgi:hypothetical protein